MKFWERQNLIRESELSGPAKETLCVINEFIGNDPDGWCFAGQAAIAKRLSLSERGLRDRIRQLIKSEYLESRRRKDHRSEYRPVWTAFDTGSSASLNRQSTAGLNRQLNVIKPAVERHHTGSLTYVPIKGTTKNNHEQGNYVSEAQEIIDAFNEAMKKQSRLTDSRKKKIRTRLKEKWWRDNWQSAITRAAQSPFLRGESDGGWAADIDWFLRPDSATKILEGNYDDRKPVQREEVCF